MRKRNVTMVCVTAGLAIAAASFPTAGLAHDGKEKRAAAAITTSRANAMQAAVVAHGEANSVLRNPYVEQKVTTPESVGVNRTKIPAGGF
jgi:hypothetical protein